MTRLGNLLARRELCISGLLVQLRYGDVAPKKCQKTTIFHSKGVLSHNQRRPRKILVWTRMQPPGFEPSLTHCPPIQRPPPSGPFHILDTTLMVMLMLKDFRRRFNSPPTTTISFFFSKLKNFFLSGASEIKFDSVRNFFENENCFFIRGP